MENICNDVSKNLMLFGLVNQKQSKADAKKVQQEDTRQAARYSPQSKATTPQAQEPMSTQALFANYLKAQEDIQKLQKIYDTFNKASNPEKAEDSAITGLMDNSIFKKKDQKTRKKKQPEHQKNTFNILGMFKPGELLESITKEEITRKNNLNSPFQMA